jgi:hypothetical protein
MNSSSSSTPPYPPQGGMKLSTPESATPARTSTPNTQQSRPRHSLRASENDTASTRRRSVENNQPRRASSSSSSKERWHTPGELSNSFSGEDIPLYDDDLPDLPPIPMIEQNHSADDASLLDESYDQSYVSTLNTARPRELTFRKPESLRISYGKHQSLDEFRPAMLSRLDPQDERVHQVFKRHLLF